MKTLKDVKPGDKVFILTSNRGYLKEPQIETLTVNKVGILYIYTDYDVFAKQARKFFVLVTKNED